MIFDELKTAWKQTGRSCPNRVEKDLQWVAMELAKRPNRKRLDIDVVAAALREDVQKAGSRWSGRTFLESFLPGYLRDRSKRASPPSHRKVSRRSESRDFSPRSPAPRESASAPVSPGDAGAGPGDAGTPTAPPPDAPSVRPSRAFEAERLLRRKVDEYEHGEHWQAHGGRMYAVSAEARAVVEQMGETT